MTCCLAAYTYISEPMLRCHQCLRSCGIHLAIYHSDTTRPLWSLKSPETSKYRIAGPFCKGNLPAIVGFPSQRTSNAEAFPCHYVMISPVHLVLGQLPDNIIHISSGLRRLHRGNHTITIIFMEHAGECFKNAYDFLDLRAIKTSLFWVEFQRVPLKFHTKYLTHTLKDVDFIHMWICKSCQN